MLEIADRLVPMLRRGAPVAVATCIDVVGSAPHAAGTSMVLGPDGEVHGVVSGGCVEAAALADCRVVLAGGGTVVRRYGFGDGAAALAGLACGGEVDVLTCLIDPASADVAGLLEQLGRRLRGEAAAVGLVTGGPDAVLGALVLPGQRPASAAGRAVEAARALGVPGAVDVDGGAAAAVRILVDVAAPAPRLLVIGATETAVALCAAATALGLAVTVCDPRPDFARPDRFPAARRVVAGAAHEAVAAFAPEGEDAVCLLSHDEDLDPLALAVALESAAGYVGALGSRATAARRAARLRDLGVPDGLVARLYAPIGLDLGARTPAETAVSIVAELLAARAAATARPLRAGSGPIHRPAAPPSRSAPALADVPQRSAPANRACSTSASSSAKRS